MTILIPLNDVFESLFGISPEDANEARNVLEDYYTIGGIKPMVEIGSDVVEITVDAESVAELERDIDEAARLASERKYAPAQEMLERLVEQHPEVSELHRMYAQVLFEQGEGDAAIDPLIDALRWDPGNVHALLLMGNVMYRVEGDLDAARLYYNRVAEIAPDDHLMLNNLGAVMMETGEEDEAERYFKKALEANPDYPNTHYGLGLLRAREGDYEQAFEYGLGALKRVGHRDPIHPNAIKLTFKAAREYADATGFSEIIDGYRLEVEEAIGKPIRWEQRPNLPTRAKVEVAETHDRPYHLLLSRPNEPTAAHLIMHELEHLKLIAEARAAGKNRLFTVGESGRKKFMQEHRAALQRMTRSGLPRESAEQFLHGIFDGMTLQVYNAPIDLFIEGRLYERFPALRPVQFLSLGSMLLDYAKQATDREVKKITPTGIYNANVIYNLTHAFQLRDMFGFDIVDDFKAHKGLLRDAEQLYDEYLQVKGDRRPGEEYSFVEDWAGDFRLDGYFSLVEDRAGREQSTVEDAISAVEQDPFNFSDPDRKEGEANRLSMEESPSGSMAVTMYLLDALQLFEGKDRSFIERVAFEVAMLGNYGLDPSDTEKKYTLNAVPNKKFSALHLLAYMYAGFKVIEPSLDTELDFGDEYEMAKKMAKQRS